MQIIYKYVFIIKTMSSLLRGAAIRCTKITVFLAGGRVASEILTAGHMADNIQKYRNI